MGLGCGDGLRGHILDAFDARRFALAPAQVVKTRATHTALADHFPFEVDETKDGIGKKLIIPDTVEGVLADGVSE